MPSKIRLKFKNQQDKILIATGDILPVQQTGGRQVQFQVEGDAVSYVWLLTFTTTWLVKNHFGRFAEGKESDLAMKAVAIVRRWLTRGLTGTREIVIHEGASLGTLRKFLPAKGTFRA